MGIDIFKWFASKETKPVKVDMKTVCYQLASAIYIRELAWAMLVNKIANTIAKCELKIYENNKVVKGDEWYRWNIQPNKNQNGTQFWNKLITMLYDHNEALVIVNNGDLFVADDFFKHDESAFYEHYFTDVRIGDFTFSKKLYMSEVYYFELNSKKIKDYLDNTLSLYTGLINAAYSSYLVANGNKGVLKIGQLAEQQEDFEETFNKMVNEDFKAFFSSANAVMPLFDGYEYDQLDNKGTQSTTRDLKAMFDDVIQLTANAIGMPVSIANGSVQDTSKAVDDFLTFCIDYLLEIITDEIDRKNYTKAQVLKGYYVRFNTTTLKHVDIFENHGAIDKLLSSGFTCVNDLRIACGLDIIDEDWAWQFFMTKNYAPIEEILKSVKGGEGNGE